MLNDYVFTNKCPRQPTIEKSSRKIHSSNLHYSGIDSKSLKGVVVVVVVEVAGGVVALMQVEQNLLGVFRC
jgi:hypothetical protein